MSAGYSCLTPDLTKCDLCILNYLRPHLGPDDWNVPACVYLHQMLACCREMLENCGIVSLATDGQVECMTRKAESLLTLCFEYSGSHMLPDPIFDWINSQIAQLIPSCETRPLDLSTHVEQAGHHLFIHLIPAPYQKHYLLVLEDAHPSFFSIAALESLGLTRREAEVLFWMAGEKNNLAIALAMGCSEGTVRKHMENVYRKLGVQTRMGAVLAALARLGLFNIAPARSLCDQAVATAA